MSRAGCASTDAQKQPTGRLDLSTQTEADGKRLEILRQLARRAFYTGSDKYKTHTHTQKKPSCFDALLRVAANMTLGAFHSSEAILQEYTALHTPPIRSVCQRAAKESPSRVASVSPRDHRLPAGHRQAGEEKWGGRRCQYKPRPPLFRGRRPETRLESTQQARVTDGVAVQQWSQPSPMMAGVDARTRHQR